MCYIQPSDQSLSGMISLRPVFVVMGLSLLSIYSFPALLLPAFSPGFSLSYFVFLRFVLLFLPVMFYLVLRVMNFVLCQGFLCISSMYASLSFGCPVMILASSLVVRVHCPA